MTLKEVFEATRATLGINFSRVENLDSTVQSGIKYLKIHNTKIDNIDVCLISIPSHISEISVICWSLRDNNWTMHQ